MFIETESISFCNRLVLFPVGLRRRRNGEGLLKGVGFLFARSDERMGSQVVLRAVLI